MKTDRVLCAIVPKLITEDFDETELWMDLEDYSTKSKITYYGIIPLINHPHSDVENGQKEVHYHADTRYNGIQPHLKNYRVNISKSRPIEGEFETRWFDLIRYFETYAARTPPELIKKSKLKHKCVHKGKCPHRGFDLSNITPVDGVITCPLHSLRFDEKTLEII